MATYARLAKDDVTRKVEVKAKAYVGEADRLAAQFSLDPRSLLRAFAAALDVDVADDVTMEQIARILFAAKDKP